MFDSKQLNGIRQHAEEWNRKLESAGERRPAEQYVTDSGIPVKRLYTPCDIQRMDYLKDVGFPGEPPYVRGIYPTMYRGRPWTMRLFSGHGTPEETNRRWKFLYENGETGFSAAVDALTFNGLDPDDERGDLEVGTTGVPLYCIDSMFALTDGIPHDKVSVALVVEPFSSAPICAMYFNCCMDKGLDLRQVRGTCQNDILTQTLGYVPYRNVAPAHLLRFACDLIEYTTAQDRVPLWHPINFTGYNYREGGIDAVQELGFVFANATAHIDELVRRGYAPDRFVNRLAFHLAAHKDFFEEIAKYRAARRIWYQLMKDRYGCKDRRSYEFRFHIQTAGSSLTAQQPMVNVVRTAYQALEAVIGGCQSMHTNSYDEAICLPSKEAVLVALRTQQVIQDETRVGYTIDPLAGSYFVEHLTAEMEKRVWEYMGAIENAGGIVKALESGWLYREMRDAFKKRQANIEAGIEGMIGVNLYADKREYHVPNVFRTNPEAMRIEQARIDRLRRERGEAAFAQAMDRLRKAVESGDNVMPAMMEATRVATVGEICDVYREVFGIWDPPIVI
ncbi:MAG: methylmalonyl-CoA mutase family protein [bacterium]